MNTTHTGQPPRTASPSPRADEVTLIARDSAKSCVRCLVHLRVQDWGLLDLLPDADRVAIELVAHAVKTTRVTGREPPWPTLGVRVSVDNCGVLLVQVRDCDRTSPFPAPGAYLDRHLAAVDELSREWNWFPLDDGKVIWAELVPRHAQPPGFLPQRSACSMSYPEPETPAAPFQDMALAQRILDGLRRLGVEGEAR